MGYRGAGTFEFLYEDGELFFIEMNTRLQVEHPVTELVTGLDLVELQLRIAAGEPLPFTQDEVTLDGHAIEVRVYAEDPRAGFLPTGGHVERVVHPSGVGIRVDTSLEDGLDVSTDYNPMLAKIIASGPDREEARRRLVAALADTAIFGFETNLTFLRLLLERPEMIAGDLDTGLIARVFDELAFPAVAPRAFAEAALILHARDAADAARAAAGSGAGRTAPTGPWARVDGWRLGGAAPSVFDLEAGADVERVRVWASPLRVAVGDADVTADAAADSTVASVAVEAGRATVSIGGVARSFPFAVGTDGVWLSDGGEAVHVRERRESYGAVAASDASPTLVSPLPGTVVMVSVADGDRVDAGDAVAVVEAMKMEHVLRATVAGTVRLGVAVGDQVTRSGIVATIEATEAVDSDDA